VTLRWTLSSERWRRGDRCTASWDVRVSVLRAQLLARNPVAEARIPNVVRQTKAPTGRELRKTVIGERAIRTSAAGDIPYSFTPALHGSYSEQYTPSGLSDPLVRLGFRWQCGHDDHVGRWRCDKCPVLRNCHFAKPEPLLAPDIASQSCAAGGCKSIGDKSTKVVENGLRRSLIYPPEPRKPRERGSVPILMRWNELGALSHRPYSERDDLRLGTWRSRIDGAAAIATERLLARLSAFEARCRVRSSQR
jgi:hypothetical protein